MRLSVLSLALAIGLLACSDEQIQNEAVTASTEPQNPLMGVWQLECESLIRGYELSERHQAAIAATSLHIEEDRIEVYEPVGPNGSSEPRFFVYYSIVNNVGNAYELEVADGARIGATRIGLSDDDTVLFFNRYDGEKENYMPLGNYEAEKQAPDDGMSCSWNR